MKYRNLLEITLNIWSVIFVTGGIVIAFDNTLIKALTKYPNQNNLVGIIIFLIGIGFFMGFYYLANKLSETDKTKDFKERHQEIIKTTKECNSCALYQRESIKQDMIEEDKSGEDIKDTLKFLDEAIDEKYKLKEN